MNAPLPPNEAERLSALRATGLLDSPEERDYDELVELASIVCGMPMALVSLVDGERQWFKARVGMKASETPRDVAFCAHAILDPDEVFEVPNAREDGRFSANPLVTGAPGLGSYFGVPLRAPSGHALGTLCVLDREPRELDAQALRALRILARQVEKLIELRETSDRALAASRAKSRFLATMSHEIRTPLHGLVGALDVAIARAGDAVDPGLVDAQRGARHLHRMLTSVLDLSKADAGAIDLAPRPTDLARLVRDVAATFDGAARGKGLVLEVRAEDVGHAQVDGTRLSQVLFNLVDNAIKFTDAGSVRLFVECADEGRARFSVSDTGIGIEPAARARIFERFEQETADREGTGLGLALARELVARMGGTLALRSEAGSGTTFHFDVDAPACDAPEDDGTEPLPEGLRVLLADDRSLSLKVSERMLAHMGFQVTAVGSGAEALERFEPGAFDLVVLDHQMPPMDGTEVARRLRADVGATQPIVGLTAFLDDHVAESCRAAGMDDVFEKPIPVDAFRERLAELVVRR